MSIARTIEREICASMRDEIAVPATETPADAEWIHGVRSWRKPTAANGTAGGEVFPQISVAVGPKYYTNVEATWAVDVNISVYTHIDDDLDGSRLADIEDAVEVFADGLQDNAAFLAGVRTDYPSFNLGAFFCDTAQPPPTAIDATRGLSLSFVLHFAL